MNALGLLTRDFILSFVVPEDTRGVRASISNFAVDSLILVEDFGVVLIGLIKSCGGVRILIVMSR